LGAEEAFRDGSEKQDIERQQHQKCRQIENTVSLQVALQSDSRAFSLIRSIPAKVAIPPYSEQAKPSPHIPMTTA
jgi:hypothetical protein